MWQAISQQLSDTLMFEFTIREKVKLPGGDINQCYMISDGEQRYFVKINQKDELSLFESEVDSLKELRHSDTVFVPEVVHLGNCKDAAFLVLNYFPTKALNTDEASFNFGQQLARLHQWGEQKEYGFDSDNYVGATLQPNRWEKKWHRFFSEQRIGWQLQLLSEKGIELGNSEAIIQAVSDELAHHHPTPSLLHGDLWSGNVANSAFGPLCFDPSCYWGDRECDIAMTELFGGFNNQFYAGYASVLPLSSGYEHRRTIYNLYHILNHCNLFGGHYLDEAQSIIEEMLS
ncbi:fructosamine kinase family protein [Vibrio maerlii]|uniref:fructosamine kinase family protein n=1 Tax=Vibrio maerlii TaxID=2231648 RepID=UPI000E3BD7D5|nr:fructosamine kinase family protein [Vibrio maerlii]